MAKITHSDLAPDEVVHYDLAGVEFELGGSGKGSYETTDRTVIASAEVHPWLSVEYPKVDLIQGQVRNTLADHPELDPLSGVGPNAGIAYDAEEIRKVEEAKAEMRKTPLAIDANLDQGEAVTVGEEGGTPVDVTLAADEDHTAAKSGKAFEQDPDVAAAAASGTLDPAQATDPTKAESKTRTTSKKGDD